jgi:hypothetical protein
MANPAGSTFRDGRGGPVLVSGGWAAEPGGRGIASNHERGLAPDSGRSPAPGRPWCPDRQVPGRFQAGPDIWRCPPADRVQHATRGRRQGSDTGPGGYGDAPGG